MIYQFDTRDEDEATAALLVYVLWRSRGSISISPKIWGQVETWIKAAAKRAETLGRFIESLKPKLRVATLSPKWIQAGIVGVGVKVPSGHRLFLTDVFDQANGEQVLTLLYRETSLIVLLVRERLERERSLKIEVQQLDIDTEVADVPDERSPDGII